MKYTFEQIPEIIARLDEKLCRIENILVNNQGMIKDNADYPMTVEEAANFLSLARATIYSLVGQKKIPVFKQGKRLYFSKQELTSWIKTGRKKTGIEIDEEAKRYVMTNKRKGGQ